MSILDERIHALERELKEGRLAIGSLDEFRKGQQDFEKWGDGVIVGSVPWLVRRLRDHMSKVGMIGLDWRPAANTSWQSSNLEGFCYRMEGSIPREGYHSWLLHR